MNANLFPALQLIAANRVRPSVRFLDAVYGSQAKKLRAEVASLLTGRTVKPSHPEAQYGNLRTSLLRALEVSGNCIATVLTVPPNTGDGPESLKELFRFWGRRETVVPAASTS